VKIQAKNALALLVTVFLMIPILPAAAQETAITRTQKLPGIDYQIAYPDGWHAKATDTAVSISQKRADFDQALGSSFAREGIEISFSVHDAQSNLNALADATRELFDCDCTTTQTELFGVPALQFRVTDAAGNAILMMVGIYEDNSFVLNVTAPSDAALDDFMPTWERIRNSIEPHVVQLYDVANAGFSVAYPQAWTVEATDSSIIIAESQTDIETVLESGRVDSASRNVITVEYARRADLAQHGLPLDATLEDFVSFNARYFGITEDSLDATPTPVIVFGEPAVEIRFTNGTSAKLVVMGYLYDEAYVIVLTSPSREARDAFLPTWDALLESTQAYTETVQF
jgi:hypothetical protein